MHWPGLNSRSIKRGYVILTWGAVWLPVMGRRAGRGARSMTGFLPEMEWLISPLC